MIVPKIFPYPDNIQRYAEKKVFEALKKIPDKNGFDIFYNKIIYNDVNPGYSEDAEADFVVFHAELGFMVIEVKGGEIFYDADKDQWFSKTLKSQKTYKIKNPYKQATTNKYAILKKFLRYVPLNCLLDHHIPRADLEILFLKTHLEKEHLERQSFSLRQYLVAFPWSTIL